MSMPCNNLFLSPDHAYRTSLRLFVKSHGSHGGFGMCTECSSHRCFQIMAKLSMNRSSTNTILYHTHYHILIVFGDSGIQFFVTSKSESSGFFTVKTVKTHLTPLLKLKYLCRTHSLVIPYSTFQCDIFKYIIIT